jgi:alkylresorcinol/alkylpyrone synthase
MGCGMAAHRESGLSMARIIGTGIAVPPYSISQDEARQFATEYFQRFLPHIDRMASVFKNTQIDTRYFVVPKEWWFDERHSLKERNDIYLSEATQIGRDAICAALDNAGIAPQEVDNLIVVSSTGFATPSLDARIINDLCMRSNVRRTPIWGLGCAGGVAGLARITEMCRAYPDSVTVLMAVETCGLTFQFQDWSKKNFIATSLFGDGAAAVVMVGDAHPDKRPAFRVLDSQSTLWRDSLRVMGWDIVDEGMEVLFGVEIPRYVADLFRPEVDRFLSKHHLTIADIEHLVFHPGGAKVLEAYSESLGVTNGHLDPSREVLRCYGNMSSPTVLFVLERVLQQRNPRPGEYALAAALGPGFSAELVLMQFGE